MWNKPLSLAGLALLCLAGCAADEVAGDAADLTQAEVVDACQASADPAACFSAEAQSKLQASLAAVERELGEQGAFVGPSGASGYRVRTTASCFDFRDRAAASAAWDQLAGAVDFLSEFHRARRGLGNRWFNDVLVCNAKDLDDSTPISGGLWGGELRLEATTLQVGVKSTLGRFQVQKGTEIRDRWDRGEQFAATALDDSKGVFRGKVWPFINPVGVAYVQTMPMIKSAIAAFTGVLERLRGVADEARMKAELLAAVQSNTAVAVSLGDRTLGEAATGAIGGMDLAGARSLVERWLAFLQDPAAAEDAFEALGTLRQGVSGRACNVDVKQICVVAVNNAHCINVSVSANAKLVARFITSDPASVPPAHQVQATQVSFVCVQTNDFVEVAVDVSVDGALKSAGLARALGL